jgi:hypothetical protein
MYKILFLVVVLPILAWLFVKLIRSQKYDKFCKDLFAGKLDTDTTSKDVMKDISKSETDLGKQADAITKEAEKLKSESNGINKFLGKRGVDAEKDKGDS